MSCRKESCRTRNKVFRITADDGGYSEERDCGILKCVSEGVVNAISVLVNGSHAWQLAERLRSDGCLQVRVGLHLNLTEGAPLSPVEASSGLATCAGLFKGKFGFRKALNDGHVRCDALEREIEAQMRRFYDIFQHMPAYVDGHQHVHILPDVADVLARVMDRHDVRETRIPRELGFEQCDWLPEAQYTFLLGVCREASASIPLFAKCKINYCPYFIGLSTMSMNFTANRIDRALDFVAKHRAAGAASVKRDDVAMIELMTHPGFKTTGDGGCGDGPDDFSRSPDREHELLVLMSEEVCRVLDKYALLWSGDSCGESVNT